MQRLVMLVAGFVLLWALFEFGALTRAPVIEADIQARTSAAIDAAGLDSVSVGTDGRDVSLHGTVLSDDEVGRAGQCAVCASSRTTCCSTRSTTRSSARIAASC